ncbi:hypothetical protein F383_32245 [Gossypium arboreum]|uniref:Uncharacterized protein n=1 Tax=Gossypium arboreum TaxID=29729 RepID=A0A0B0N285_GOSAR|nr:hypothetical protein F383_32245 [Gossypium arboreum]
MYRLDYTFVMLYFGLCIIEPCENDLISMFEFGYV